MKAEKTGTVKEKAGIQIARAAAMGTEGEGGADSMCV